MWVYLGLKNVVALNKTKKVLLFGFIFGLVVFFTEDIVFGVFHPEWAATYANLVVIHFCAHAMTFPSMIWLIFVVVAILVKEPRSEDPCIRCNLGRSDDN